MQTQEKLKEIVREKYGQIADKKADELDSGCCGATAGCGTDVMAESYANVDGYVPQADLGLGCGLPTEFAKIKEGDVVVDLGSGAGNDAFIARRIVGDKGQVIGVDMTASMITRARKNTEQLGYANVDFRLGEIENLPIAANSVDVVVSNCVLNLVPDKKRALSETFRVLKPGAHFSISDIVIKGELPARLREDAEMYAGCVSGAVDRDEYLETIRKVGFENSVVQKEHRIELPEELMVKYMTAEELESLKAAERGIYSITVYAEKPTPESAGRCC